MKILITLVLCAILSAVFAVEPVQEEKSVPAAADVETVDDEAADTNVVETATASEKTEDPGFERYKTIMDRMPFGREPPGFDPDSPGSGMAGGVNGMADDGTMSEAAKSEEEKRIIASVRVSVLNVTPSGKVAVGFTDSSKQPTANYYLKVGESRDGWKVESADPAEQTVKLSHDGVEAELKLGEGSAGGDGKGKPGALGARGMMGGGVVGHRLGLGGGGGRLARQSENDGNSGSPGSALSRLRERRQRTQAEIAAEAERRKQAEEQEKIEKAQAAEERQQQLTQLMQIQEELKRQREEKAAAEAERQQSEGGAEGVQQE